METEATLKHLARHGIKPSIQRMAVIDFLMGTHSHPTADDIYNALHPKLPTLSRTTIYNTLKLLVEQGAARQVTIDERNSCYDAVTTEHAHFKCKRCGKVFDIPLRTAKLEDVAAIPEGFQTEQSALYFHGLCEACAKKAQEEDAQKN